MSSKVTELDRAVARNIKSFRESGGLTQKHVAEFLDMSYQSYQKLEGGRISFRVSVLDRLAQLYNKRLHELVQGGDPGLDQRIVKAAWAMHGMTDEERDAAVRAVLHIKRGKTK